MKLATKNTESIQMLMSVGLFQTESEAVDSIIEYAYGMEDFEEFELEIDSENLNHLKNLSEKTGAPVNFVFNRIVERYLDSEELNDNADSKTS